MSTCTIAEFAVDDSIRSLEAIRQPVPAVEDSYQMGRDCALNDPDDHLFATPESTLRPGKEGNPRLRIRDDPARHI
jgi:hypothetical protein